MVIEVPGPEKSASSGRPPRPRELGKLLRRRPGAPRRPRQSGRRSAPACRTIRSAARAAPWSFHRGCALPALEGTSEADLDRRRGEERAAEKLEAKQQAEADLG